MQESFLSQEELSSKEYLALARKYRPKTFSDIIGQPILVQTLTNAIINNRTPHAIILTGIRGVGKTTTARIIARALNCIGKDGTGQSTINPCGICEHCQAINDDRHQDVLEIDAASHTGVNDIREIIENARYKPISARYKIYIIDEVHMLSNNAFNALLKTLEEPPLHVKFIFATTELRKIPITILSRCQRFDLRRVDINELIMHYTEILKKEHFEAENGALTLIATVAQGSVRDGLSILDQALSHTQGLLKEADVRKMLGLADLQLIFTLFETMVTGKTLNALKTIKELYEIGADPNLIIQDLLEITHNITKVKVANSQNIFNFAEYEWGKYLKFSTKLSIIFLSRCWQMLLKGLEEMKSSLFPFAHLEMILIRIAHASLFPLSEENLTRANLPNINLNSNILEPINNNAPTLDKSQNTFELRTFEDLTKLCLEKNEMLLYHHLISDVRLVRFEPMNIVLKFLEHTPKNFALTLQHFLYQCCGQKWSITASAEECTTATIIEQVNDTERLLKEKIANSELVQGILNTFTETEIIDIKTTKSF